MANDELTETRPLPKAAVREASAQGAMQGSGEAYLIPFAVILGAGDFFVGLLASLPLLIGSLFQIVSLRRCERHGSKRRLVNAAVLVQAGAWLGLAALAWFPTQLAVLWLCLGAFAFYAAFNYAIPAWSAWMAELLPAESRSQFYGARGALVSMGTAVAFVVGALLLELAPTAWRLAEARVYAILFAAAGVFRLISAGLLSRLPNVESNVPAPTKFGFFKFLRAAQQANFSRFVIFVGIFHAAVHFSAPLFVPFYLRDLGLSYPHYAALAVVALVSQYLTFRRWGSVAEKYGTIRVLRIAMTLAILLPLPYVLDVRFPMLLLYQFISGFVWAGIGLATQTFVLEAVEPQNRARCVAYQTVVTNIGIGIGALLGGLAATVVGGYRNDILALGLESHLQIIFVASFLLRILPTWLLLRTVRDVRTVTPGSAATVLFRVTGFNGVRGLTFQISPLRARLSKRRAKR